MNTWSGGRAALLGDAAFCAWPMAGNGTSMALVGAYALAAELATAPDHATAFRRYEEEMHQDVARCQEFAPDGVDSLMPKSRVFIRMRDFSLRVVPHIPAGEVVRRPAGAGEHGHAAGLPAPELDLQLSPGLTFRAWTWKPPRGCRCTT